MTGIYVYMADYSDVFTKCTENFNTYTGNLDEVFWGFRQQPPILPDMYSFIGTDDQGPDENAIKVAKSINESLYDKYIESNSSQKIIGYGNYIPVNAQFTLHDSRHIMMSVILFTYMNFEPRCIVEIGGGFGNWLRLNSFRTFETWTIVDLPHVLKLQEWYFENQDISRHRLLPAGSSVEHVDLVIGAHSLSEMSLQSFTDYFEKIIKKSKFLFYSWNKYSLDNAVLQEKIRMIESRFRMVIDVPSQNGHVSNTLYAAEPNLQF
jgi:hypothetical protein